MIFIYKSLSGSCVRAGSEKSEEISEYEDTFLTRCINLVEKWSWQQRGKNEETNKEREKKEGAYRARWLYVARITPGFLLWLLEIKVTLSNRQHSTESCCGEQRW
jgi:hypothetical protein